VSTLQSLIIDLCPNGVPRVKIDDLIAYEQPTKYLVASKSYDDSYPTPVLTAGQSFLLGYTNEEHGKYAASIHSPVIIFDDFTTAYKWVDFEFKVKSSAMKMLTAKAGAQIRLRYFWYALSTIHIDTSEHARYWISKISNLDIPLPPLDIQDEIVRILDTFIQLEADLNAELEARKVQYEYFSKLMLDSKDAETERVSVSDVCHISRGVVISKDYLRAHPGDFPVYSSQTLNNGIFGYIDTYAYDFESLTWTTDGANAGSIFFHKDEKFTITNVCGLLQVRDPARISTRFLFYVLSAEAPKHVSAGMGNPKLMAGSMGNIQFNLPPIEKQLELVNVLDKFDLLVNGMTGGLPAEIDARRAQYEHYRSKLLTFNELELA